MEQEALAQIINEVYSDARAPRRMRDTIPHSAPLPRRNNRGFVQVVRSPDQSDHSEQDSLIAEALGQEGLQVFIDAGADVDENLVNALIKEVLEERIQNMIGQRTARFEHYALVHAFLCL